MKTEADRVNGPAASVPARARDAAAVLVPFADEHLHGALRLSQEMAWPYRLEDWAVALGLGQGFVLQDDAGAVVGTALWWPCGDDQASAGMVIVARAAQGRGHGARLMEALLAAAGSRSITLNSTAEGRALYERRGFVRIGEVHQHQGVAAVLPKAPSPTLVRVARPSDSAAIAQLDRQATGWRRGPLLDRLCSLGAGLLRLRDGEPCGYAIARPFGRGHVVGPVVADSAADARLLVEAAIARLGRAFVRIDTPAGCGLGEWLEGLGLPRVGDAATMVRGPRHPPVGPAQAYALASQSFN